MKSVLIYIILQAVLVRPSTSMAISGQSKGKIHTYNFIQLRWNVGCSLYYFSYRTKITFFKFREIQVFSFWKWIIKKMWYGIRVCLQMRASFWLIFLFLYFLSQTTVKCSKLFIYNQINLKMFKIHFCYPKMICRSM